MSKKGITINGIITAAVEMVEENGFHNLSLRELAGKLDVKPSSLYNHVKGIDEIITSVGMYGIHILEDALMKAIKSESLETSINEMAQAYRNFAKNSPELYQAIIELQMSDNDVLKKELYKVIQPFVIVIEKYVEDNNTAIHLQRYIRSSLHGFVSLEKEGYMAHGDISTEESFEFMVKEFIQLVKAKKATR